MSVSNRYHGAMLSVGISADQARSYLKFLESKFGICEVCIACMNSPSNLTLSGRREQLLKLIPRLEEERIFNRLLRIDVAYHSPQMAQIAHEYYSLIGTVEEGVRSTKSPRMLSSLKGRWVTADDVCNAQYWVDNMTMPVRFSEAFHYLTTRTLDSECAPREDGHVGKEMINTILEVGPHSTLEGPIKECLRSQPNGRSTGYGSVLKRSSSAFETLLGAVGMLYCQGCTVDLSMVNKSTRRQQRSPKLLANLPQYPFNESHIYWPKTVLDKGFRFRSKPRNDLLGTRTSDWNPLDAKWQNIIKVSELSWVKDHVVNFASCVMSEDLCLLFFR